MIFVSTPLTCNFDISIDMGIVKHAFNSTFIDSEMELSVFNIVAHPDNGLNVTHDHHLNIWYLVL